jgi:Flp pilus assembly protein TadG
MSSLITNAMRRFRREQRGSVGLIFALSAIPFIGVVGAAYDYNRASNLRGKMATAADAAVLAAVKAPGASIGDREKLASAVFKANLGSDSSLTALSVKLSRLSGNGYRVDATASYEVGLIRILPGMDDHVAIKVFAEANAGEGKLEVALVLDNTGSMASDMGSLRKAATDFTNILFESAGTSADLKMSVIPYVAAVNPGRLNLGMSSVDTRGESAHQAQTMRWRWIAMIPNCNPDPNPKPPSGGGWSPPGPGPGTPGSGAWLQDAARKFGAIGQEVLGELFGVKSAAAQVGAYGTPNRTAPFTGTMFEQKPPYVPAPVKVLVPNGFTMGYHCYLHNPGQISHLDLFDGIKTKSGKAQWKGCVEARPEPYDVTDEPPSAGNPNTRFSPYFWADEPGTADQGNALKYANNYMDDGDAPPGFHRMWEWEWMFNLFKYDGQNKNAKINETAPNTSGPNKACPDELLRLTSDKDKVLSKIKDLKHWNGGGTIGSEGVMWGWRTLSPNLPFADGAAYGTAGNRKVLVIMTDGENTIGGNNVGGPVMSQYNAYGYMRWGRFPMENFQEATKYLDGRMRQACTNAKAKGVQVISILFRVDTASSQQLLKDCASSGSLFYLAKNQAELEKAFRDVAESIGRLRLSR